MTAPSGYDIRQVPNMTPEMKQFFGKLMNAIGPGAEKGAGFLSKLASGDEEMFKQLEAPAYAGLERGLSQTANRFSQFGAQDSSAFENALSGQSAELGQNLQSQRTQLMMSAIDKLLGQSQSLLGQKPNENVLQQQGGPDWGQLIGKLLPVILSAFGPAGTAAGTVASVGLQGATGKAL